tara:strand:+ start:3788 stop:4948 length:1161 start_codon:yes stop_codon:yes gene_type:complete
VWIEAGRIRGTAKDAAGVRRLARRAGARVRDLGDAVLTAGLVNAHSHLELHALAGRVSAGGGFGAWIARLLEVRATCRDDVLSAGARKGADRMLATGTTTVGDIDSLGLTLAALRGHPLRVRAYRELLDARDPARTKAAVTGLSRMPRGSSRRLPGLAPHAPFTVSEDLLAAAARVARTSKLPVTIHWAETAAEVAWMREGSGPLSALLQGSPRTSGLTLFERHGLLGPSTSLVHGNLPGRGEPGRIAATGATVVHCPGCHAFFDREPFPLARYRRAGVPLALGTDSAASNGDVDLRREMALLRSTHPGLAPKEVWRMATIGSAHALGLGRHVGRIATGMRADLALFERNARSLRDLLDGLTASMPPVRGTWVDGRPSTAPDVSAS